MDPNQNDQNGQNPVTPQDDGGMGGQTPAPEPQAPDINPNPAPEPGPAPEETPSGGMEVPPPPPAMGDQGDGSQMPGSDQNPAA